MMRIKLIVLFKFRKLIPNNACDIFDPPSKVGMNGKTKTAKTAMTKITENIIARYQFFRKGVIGKKQL